MKSNNKRQKNNKKEKSVLFKEIFDSVVYSSEITWCDDY